MVAGVIHMVHFRRYIYFFGWVETINLCVIDPPGLVSPDVHEIVAIQLLVSNMFARKPTWNVME